MNQTLKELVANSQSIHITTHLNPDYDAYASLTFMYALIKKNFPEKNVSMSVDAECLDSVVSYLPFYNDIAKKPLATVLQENAIQLLVIVDVPSIKRTTKDIELVYSLLKNTSVAIFDHHEIEDTDIALLVNVQRYAAVEVIYSYAQKNELELPEKWEVYYLTGFVGDSYRFYYQYQSYRESFEAIATILDHGYTIREYSDKLYGYTKNDFIVFKLLLNHLTFETGYAFTYITWDEYINEIKGVLTTSEFKKARRFFIDEMLVKTYSVDFAVFIVPDDSFYDGKTFSGSIRSKDSTIDCTIIARQLGGGGHKTGAGFTVVSESLENALTQTKDVIGKFESAARIITQKEI